MVEQLQQPSVEQQAEQEMLNGQMPNLQELKQLSQFDEKPNYNKYKSQQVKTYDKKKTKLRSKEFDVEKQSEFVKKKALKKGMTTKIAPSSKIWNEESFQVFREDSD